RESVDLMIASLNHKKARPIYEKLFNQYHEMLTEDEEKHLRHDFISHFDNPFANKLTSSEDISKCLGEVSSQEDFDLLYEYVLRVSERVNFSSDDSLWGRFLLEIVKCQNKQYIAWLINWFQSDNDNKWWPLIPVNRVYAELIRLSCQYDKPECIDMLRYGGVNYDDIREECWDEPCVAYDKEDDEHSSPLAFAIDANSKNCYMILLSWLIETNSSFKKEGKYVWIESELKDIFTGIPDLLKEKGLDWPISLE
ncbi:MAG: hypothetical protein J5752_05325, partial [Clostridiales bacterium]|nr:hypothetical protein [Clostridiales bacterium]